MNEPTGKRCTKCGQIKPLTEFYRDKSARDGLKSLCKGCANAASAERQRRYYEAHPERRAEKNARYYQANGEMIRQKTRERHAANPEKAREAARQYAQSNPEKARERGRRHRESVRDAVFGHYGRSCACCGATENLCIDHVNGDGKEHRIELFGKNHASPSSMYRWLIKNGFPEGFQTLCRRCNRSKGDNAACQIDHDSLPNAA